MKKQYLLFLIVIFFSCAEKSSEEIYQGKLKELIVGDFVLEKDSLTRGLSNIKVVSDSGEDYLVFSRSARKFNGWGFVFQNLKTGKEKYVIEILLEGPNSMKGGVSGTLVHDQNTIFLIT